MGWLQALAWFFFFVLLLVMLHWFRYPGPWVYTFGVENQGKRDALDRCRAGLREAKSASKRRQNDAERVLRRAEQAHQRDVREAEKQLRSLRQAHPGPQVAILGRVALHKNVLRVYKTEGALDEDGNRAPASGLFDDYQLDELVLEHGPASTEPEYHLEIKPHAQKPQLVHYLAREYPEREVKQFAMQLQYEIDQAHAARHQKELDIAQAQEELDAARGETEAVDQARAQYKKVIAEEENNLAIPRARAALDDCYEVWRSYTGLRPWL